MRGWRGLIVGARMLVLAAATMLAPACIATVQSASTAEVLDQRVNARIVFMRNGGWCWFQDPAAIITDGNSIYYAEFDGEQFKRVDGNCHPHIANSLELSGDDQRYRLANWTGRRGHDCEIADAGPKGDRSSINWKPLTRNSPHKNIRRMIVAGDSYKLLLWMAGPCSHFEEYESDIVGHVLERPSPEVGS